MEFRISENVGSTIFNAELIGLHSPDPWNPWGFQDAGEVHLCSELTSITSRRLEPAESVSR